MKETDEKMVMTSEEGRMTCEEFLSACSSFLQHPAVAATGDSWKLEGNAHEFGESFLSLRTLRHEKVELSPNLDSHRVDKPEPLSNVNLLTLDDADDEHDKEQDRRKQNNSQLLHYRFDILYSVSHCVPVLYFMISETSGRLLSLDEVWNLSGIQGERGKESLWNVVSLQDHPILHNPFYCVHPCNNWAIMKELLQGKDHPITCLQFLISWLSIIGNQFGLKLSPAYFQNI